MDSQISNDDLYLKIFFTNISRGRVGGAFLGELKHEKGTNYIEFSIDTQYFVPGSYYANFVLYLQDDNGNVTTHDSCRAMFFNIEHGMKSKHIREWYSNWGTVVLPCLSYIE